MVYHYAYTLGNHIFREQGTEKNLSLALLKGRMQRFFLISSLGKTQIWSGDVNVFYITVFSKRLRGINSKIAEPLIFDSAIKNRSNLRFSSVRPVIFGENNHINCFQYDP